MQHGKGVKPEKLDKVFSKITDLGDGEIITLFVRSNNMRPLADALVVTNARVLAIQTSTGQIKFSVFGSQIAEVAYDAKGKTVQVEGVDGSTMTFKQVHGDDIPLVQAAIEQLRQTPLSPELTQAIESAGPQVDPNLAEDGPLRSLSEKARRKMASALNEDEVVKLAREGEYAAIVATDKRVIIAKWGATTGSMFSTQANSWGLKQISGIEARRGMTTNALVVQASGNQSVTKFGRMDKGSDSVHEAPNALFLRDGVDETAAALRILIAEAHESTPAQAAPTATDPVDQIRKLAALRDEGILTEDEFTAKKHQLLGL